MMYIFGPITCQNYPGIYGADMGMFFRKMIFAILVMLLWSHPASAAKEPLYLEPSSKWVMHYDEDSCRLIRSFGKDRNQVSLILSRFGPGH
ncbi:MAG: hypothetical protein AAGM33_12625, partial [Pseudomonadota bacterium]